MFEEKNVSAKVATIFQELFKEQSMSVKGTIKFGAEDVFRDNNNKILNTTFSNVSYRKPSKEEIKNRNKNENTSEENILNADVCSNKEESVNEGSKIKGTIRGNDAKEENINQNLSIEDLCSYINNRELVNASNFIEAYKATSQVYNNEDTKNIVVAIKTSMNNVTNNNVATKGYEGEARLMCDLLKLALNKDLNLRKEDLGEIVENGIRTYIENYVFPIPNYLNFSNSIFQDWNNFEDKINKGIKTFIDFASNEFAKYDENFVKNCVVIQIKQKLVQDLINMNVLVEGHTTDDVFGALDKLQQMYSYFLKTIFVDDDLQVKSIFAKALIAHAKDIFDSDEFTNDKKRVLGNALNFIKNYGGRKDKSDKVICDAFKNLYSCVVQGCKKGWLDENYIDIDTKIQIIDREKAVIRSILEYYARTEKYSEFKTFFCDKYIEYYCGLAFDKLVMAAKDIMNIADYKRGLPIKKVRNAYNQCSEKDYNGEYVNKERLGYIQGVISNLKNIASGELGKDNRCARATAYINCVEAISESLLEHFKDEDSIEDVCANFRKIITREMSASVYKPQFNNFMQTLREKLPKIYEKLKEDEGEELSKSFNSKKMADELFLEALNDENDNDMVELRNFFNMQS